VASASPSTAGSYRLIPLHGSDAQPPRTFFGDCSVDGTMEGEFVIDNKNDVIPAYLI
jgi:hypothetical protein